MEVTDLVQLGIVSSIVSAVFCIVAASVLHNFRMRDVSILEARVNSLEMALRGEKGRAIRGENQEAEAALMAKVAAGVQSGKPIGDVLKEALASDPGTAMRLAKKLGIGL